MIYSKLHFYAFLHLHLPLIQDNRAMNISDGRDHMQTYGEKCNHWTTLILLHSLAHFLLIHEFWYN